MKFLSALILISKVQRITENWTKKHKSIRQHEPTISYSNDACCIAFSEGEKWNFEWKWTWMHGFVSVQRVYALFNTAFISNLLSFSSNGDLLSFRISEILSLKKNGIRYVLTKMRRKIPLESSSRKECFGKQILSIYLYSEGSSSKIRWN